MSTAFQCDVFLSHNSADQPRVQELAERVQSLCLSPAALGSEWSRVERSTGLFLDPTTGLGRMTLQAWSRLRRAFQSMPKKVLVGYRHEMAEGPRTRLCPALAAGGAEVVIECQELAADLAAHLPMKPGQELVDRHLLRFTPDCFQGDSCNYEMRRGYALDPGAVPCVFRMANSMSGAGQPADNGRIIP